MAQIEQILTDVQTLTRQNRVQEAQDKLSALVEAMSGDELQRWDTDIRQAIQSFLPKRRRQLSALLDSRLTPPKLNSHQSTLSPFQEDARDVHRSNGKEAVDLFRVELRQALKELSDRYIFRWSGEYRDRLLPLLEQCLARSQAEAQSTILIVLRDELAMHTQEIFEKGYKYVRDGRSTHEHAIYRSASGLQRFLELPIEYYSAHVSRDVQGARAGALRTLVSAALRGILIGYAHVHFGPSRGADYLERISRSWAHYLGFLTASDLVSVLAEFATSAFKEQIEKAIYPLLWALDDLINSTTVEKPLPIMGQFIREQARLEIAVRAPPQSESPAPIDIICLLDATCVSTITLREAANRDAAIVLGELRPNLRQFVESNPVLSAGFVNVADMQSEVPTVCRAVRDRLEYALFKKRSLLAATAVLDHNMAQSFPLGNPFLTQYFRVHRASVARLLKTFERRNGVRLWCSVRRSGKTTACFDLETTQGGPVVVSQTCDTTVQTPDSSLFFDAVREALKTGDDLPKDFMDRTVGSCAETGPAEGGGDRYVFVLDEYETLFGRLKVAAKKDLSLRYAVVQPLLNQMVAFARNNLLVFLGQQPDAHFILMDQNQLSGAVEQDPFPLFSHASSESGTELGLLVSRVLGERAMSHPSFLDAIYGETAGHPYLTVKVLVDFVDWLIEQRRKIRELRFDADDFLKFSAARFQKNIVAGNPEYAFFREAISQAIGRDGREDNAWLHCVYRIVRQIALDSRETFRVSRGDVANEVVRLQSEGLDIDADVVIESAIRSNFLQATGRWIEPRIRILARIASCTRVPQGN